MSAQAALSRVRQAGAEMRAWRASWRLLRVLAHIVAGLVTTLRFGSMRPAQRHAAIARWAQGLLHALGVRLTVQGTLRPGAKLLIANHVSWLDIPALHAVVPEARFVSKAAVRDWPLLARLVDAAGTLYLTRENKRDALRVIELMAQALAEGDTVAVFPEGTTGPGAPLLPFHGNLLQAAIRADVPIQPVALRWHEPGQHHSTSAQFIGQTTLLQSLWRIAGAQELCVAVTILPAHAATHADRRRLAEHLSELIGERLAPR